MPDAIRLWEVESERLHEIAQPALDLEARLEAWLLSDIRALSDGLLIVGAQLETDAGGHLDLLCIDRQGDLTVVELKRGQTPRDVTAQALDYGAWAASLSGDDVVRYGDAHHGGDGAFEAAFAERFGTPLPDVLNAAHHLLIVASVVDARSERIVRYLTEQHNVSINAVTFNYFQTADGRELLARTYLVEPEAVEQRTERASTGKRRRVPTLEEHRENANANGVADVFDRILSGITGPLSNQLKAYPNQRMVTVEARSDRKAVLNLIPGDSDRMTGLRFNVYAQRLGRAFGLTADAVLTILPKEVEPWSYASDAVDAGAEWSGYTGVFRDAQDVERFMGGLIARAGF